MTIKRFWAFVAVFFLAQLVLATMALAQTEQAAKSDSQAKPDQSAQSEQQAKPEQPVQTDPQANPEQPPKPMRLRVSAGVAEGLKIHDVTPRYPVEARQQRIQGDVLLQARIDTKGNIVNLKVVQGDPILVAAAVDAVKQWRYRPYILKGEPVEVETTIRVQFHMR
jgi:TonB family protein